MDHLIVLNSIMDIAKENRLDPRGLAPMIFFLKGSVVEGIIPALFSDHDTKLKYLFIAGVTAKAKDADGVAFVCDAAMRRMDDPKEAEYINQNLDTEAPLTYPEGHPVRQECIILVYCNFITGVSNQLVQEYANKDGVITYGKFTEDFYRLEGAIINTLKRGYEQSDQVVQDMEQARILGKLPEDPLEL
jgi:hypothetical protein